MKRSVPSHRVAPIDPSGVLASLEFATPFLRPGLSALQGPQHRLLSHAEVSQPVLTTTPLLDIADPIGDDNGVGPVLSRGGNLSYPANANFRPGSFDLTRFTVHTDSTCAAFTLHFRALSDPGWHPEYGFQLTMAAIAIDTDGKPGSGKRDVPAESHYTIPGVGGFERCILVGGGVRLEDGKGKILAEYVPSAQDAANPIGNSAAGVIRFSLPVSLLGAPGPNWRFVVVAGAQDDHGGAGIGEFRAVHAERGEWNGGGRLRSEEPNIYDELLSP
jgi:carbohydrate-binding DOMON domain-containing protein